MVSALDRKLLRDLWAIRGQALAICLVMAAGLATFVMSWTAMRSLQRSRDTYYEQARFADVFAHVKRAPLSLVERIGDIPGVRQIDPRIVTEVQLDVPGLNEPAVGRLISLPIPGNPGLNAVYLREGRLVDPTRENEVVVSEPFAEAHGFRPGDFISAVINGRHRELQIVGIGLSPEYLIQIRAGSLLPDDERYGIFWMGYRQLAAAMNMEGAFNDVTLSLLRGAVELDVIEQLDALTEPYGAIGAYGREDQLSHQYISDEIRQLSAMGTMVPSIFLSVAAFLLNVVMSRVMGTQREQVAAIKAFGYGTLEVGWHYLKMVLVLVVMGVAGGVVSGVWLGQGLTDMYSRFYRFPSFQYDVDLVVLGSAIVICGGAAVAGTSWSVRRTMRLPPAEAMRPEPPAAYRPTFLERWGLGGWFSQPARMVLRQLERKPVHAALSCLGIAMAVSVLVLGNFSADAVRFMIDYQFNVTQRQNVLVTFFEPLSSKARGSIRQLPGIIRSEPFRTVPCRLRFGHVSRRLAILGLPPDGELYQLHDTAGHRVMLPPEGLLLTDKLADLLRVRVGDEVRVETLEGRRMQATVPVSAIVQEFAGLNAYMSWPALSRIMREQASISGVYLQVDTLQLDELYRELKATPAVSSVMIKEAAVANFERTMAENLLMMRFYNVMFASIIAFGVVYNCARVSLAERSREFATLRVMGLSRQEISALLWGELAVLTSIAIPLGLLLGYSLAAWVVTGLDTELYRIPLVVNRSTYGMAASVVLIATLMSGWVVRRRIDHLDLISVLKARE